jgi:hypothetical protein
MTEHVHDRLEVATILVSGVKRICYRNFSHMIALVELIGLHHDGGNTSWDVGFSASLGLVQNGSHCGLHYASRLRDLTDLLKSHKIWMGRTMV